MDFGGIRALPAYRISACWLVGRAGLQEQADELPIEQDSSAQWDDAVVAVRANDGPWMAENLVEWMSEYYGHDRVYVLNPDNEPVRATEKGNSAPSRRFEADATAVLPSVQKLRNGRGRVRA
jgi:sensor domain CHASE-containing protein